MSKRIGEIRPDWATKSGHEAVDTEKWLCGRLRGFRTTQEGRKASLLRRLQWRRTIRECAAESWWRHPRKVLSVIEETDGLRL